VAPAHLLMTAVEIAEHVVAVCWALRAERSLRPYRILFALHYAESSPGTHHEIEWFLGTTLGLTRNTTFGW
jgi:hypothetical protein